MSTPADLVRDHREHYLQRKLARSPLLKFMPGAHRLDVCSLFGGITADTPTQNVCGVTSPTAFLQALVGPRLQATLHNVRAPIVQKLKKMKLSAEETLRSTGQHALYVGYPCIVVPGEAGKTKFAPIFLFAVDVDARNSQVTVARCCDASAADESVSDGEDAIFNRLLSSYVKREFDVTLKSKDPRYSIDGATFGETVKNIFSTWSCISNEWLFPNVSPCLSADQLKIFVRSTSDPCIVDHAILGLADFTGQALLDDLDQIEIALRDGAPCSEPLKKLLERKTFGDEAPIALPKNEIEKWLVEKSDPSQEAVVWTQRNASVVVLQGPPGTGKSQTIVNTIADALAAAQSVLVVCQKSAATHVVRKRLGGVGLGELCTLIDDLDKDRSAAIKRLKSIDSEFSTATWSVEERDRSAMQLLQTELAIDAGVDALNDDNAGQSYRYRDILSVLSSIQHFDEHEEWTGALRLVAERYVDDTFTKRRLRETLNDIRRFDSRARELSYPENTWSNVDPRLAEDVSEVDRLRASLRTALSMARKLQLGVFELTHDEQTRWVAQHPWLSDTRVNDLGLPHFLDSPQRAKAAFDFNQWLAALRHINRWNAVVCPDEQSREVLRGQYSADLLSEVEQESNNLANIAALRSNLHQNELFKSLDTTLSGQAKQWESHVHGLILHVWKRRLLDRCNDGFRHARSIVLNRDQLATHLVNKRDADAQDILRKYDRRVAARDRLDEQALLRIRGSGRTPKTTLRRLYVHGGEHVNRAQPVLLTSPETASALLPLTALLYDLVVIDEASQMFVAEAIPMLFRAKRALIAGDRMQMPPSDFFAFSDEDDGQQAAEDESSDLGVIGTAAADGIYRLLDAADEALGGNSPHRKSLEIHYRSARKELIDFSNHAFYEGKLIIPSGNAALPHFMSAAIMFEQLAGVFNKGLNEVEAHRIVDWLSRIWMSPENDRPTVGVIVNNIKQKARVEELLAERAEINSAFAVNYEHERSREIEGEDVSFFVRSVESVQGDERDVIIFGATYSGDSRGFGPLTKRDDGRKRLNVAVTRAKRGMIVLCSLNVLHISNEAEQKTHERYFMWQYLRYARATAQHDASIVDSVLTQLNPERQVSRRISPDTESPFEEAIKEFVESLGFVADSQVGESGFRIDLGVKVAANDLNYLCGLECDGAPYHSGWAARTRDVWRQEILESKGWQIIRIWSTDWFENQAASKLNLMKELKKLKDDRRMTDANIRKE
jgi:arginine repressor